MAKKESVTELSESKFTEFIEDDKAKLVIVDFFAEWCFPCTMMAPVLDNVAEKLSSKGVKVGKINVDDAQKVSMKYEISSIPCIVFFKNGKEAGRSVGALTEEQLEDKLNGLL